VSSSLLQKKLRESVQGKDSQLVTYPLKPIGYIRSCFSQRNGTPRQPLLVKNARSTLTLRAELTEDFLCGLEDFSHCWILYMFHENTDFQKVWNATYDGVRGKIRVPRLNGAKRGVFATRSPHRPCPIGLSVAKVVSVEGGTVTFAGADIVDGSPVIDIKPYVPFCDAVKGAVAPSWVDAAIDDDPLQALHVELSPTVREELHTSWQSSTSTLFSEFDAFLNFVMEALSRDIRSVAQRIKVPRRERQGLEQTALSSTVACTEGKWHVILDTIDISYDIDNDTNTIIIHSSKPITN
jgi:tRNA-Thr(GGU) m(6)t(6)A37 methyltransferase TsaA